MSSSNSASWISIFETLLLIIALRFFSFTERLKLKIDNKGPADLNKKYPNTPSKSHFIIQRLRQSGIFVLPALVTFERKDVKARPAQYVNLKVHKSKVSKAKGPQRRVYGRVPVELKNICSMLSSARVVVIIKNVSIL